VSRNRPPRRFQRSASHARRTTTSRPASATGDRPTGAGRTSVNNLCAKALKKWTKHIQLRMVRHFQHIDGARSNAFAGATTGHAARGTRHAAPGAASSQDAGKANGSVVGETKTAKSSRSLSNDPDELRASIRFESHRGS
jgi:hypothetical protein